MEIVVSEEKVRFLPYDEAVKLVAAIQEEEDIHRENHRILTVYNQDNKEVCWFDFDEVMQSVKQVKSKDEQKEIVTEYILHHIPDWAKDI